MDHPIFMLDKPEPILKHRLFNGRKYMVWEGKVKLRNIKGWVDNPRIDLAKKVIHDRVGNRELTQNEIFELMKSEPEFRLKELRDDIMKNGLRTPITLSFEGKLLDGNRRFFALLYVLDSLGPADSNKEDFEIVDAYVLNKEATQADEENVLVEENFSPSLKLEWPDYVKAQKVTKARNEGLNEEQIAKKFNWPKSKVKDTLKIAGIIEDFEAFASDKKDPTDESGGGLGLTQHEAETVAAKSYQYFNEAQKSFYDPLMTDVDFKIQFFKWINKGKFSSFPEVRIAYRAWIDPEARPILMQDDPNAAKAAKATLDYNDRVVRSADEAVGRIDSFIKFLKQMKAADIKALPAQTRQKLKEALSLVEKMSHAANKK